MNQDDTSFVFVFLLGRYPTHGEILATRDLKSSELVEYLICKSEFFTDRFGFKEIASRSGEAITRETVKKTYRLILNREPEPLLDTESICREVETLSNLRRVVLQSAEFGKLVNNCILNFPREQLVDFAYRLLLKRIPSKEEISNYNCEVSNVDLVNSIYQSDEFAALSGYVQARNLKNKSLLLVGHPKGMTSEIYRTLCKVLKEYLSPSPASDGEILNNERYAYSDDKSNAPPFMERVENLDDRWLEEFYSRLDQYSKGFVVKDVLYPSVVSRYLRDNPDRYNVVFIDRPTNEVLKSSKMAGWDWLTESHINECKLLFANYTKLNTSEYIENSISLYNCVSNFYSSLHFFDYQSNPNWNRYKTGGALAINIS